MSNSKTKPYVIGVTGVIGSGKSTVGRALEKLGVPVVDSDQVVHELFDSDEAMRTAICSRFGENTIKVCNGIEQIDRAALGRIVFSDPAARGDLEAIVHPATIEGCRKKIEEHKGSDFVAVLVPLLFEARLEEQYDEIWTVFADEETLRKRLGARDALSMEEIDMRLAAQLPQKEKTARAKRIIDNSGTREQTETQVERLLEELQEEMKHAPEDNLNSREGKR